MLEWIAIISLISALGVLTALSWIDLREGILPNKLVLSFFILGLIFQACSFFQFVSLPHIILGCLIGGGFLYAVRLAAERFYGEDALGLGDVKLLAAAGAWLGPYYILIAITLGACAGLLHGLGLALYMFKQNKIWPEMQKLSLPAGPGFAIGIILSGVLMLLTETGALK
jgi:leader peptidase (prepilin peptidase)/N-methyltransferase